MDKARDDASRFYHGHILGPGQIKRLREAASDCDDPDESRYYREAAERAERDNQDRENDGCGGAMGF